MKKYRVLGWLFNLKDKGFFSSKKFLAVAVCVFMCSIAIAGGIIFNAGQINGTVSITDTAPTYYDCSIEGSTCPVIITETIEMLPDDEVIIEYNIANNEAFTLQADFEVKSIDSGLTVTFLDGTLSPMSSLSIAGGTNKYFNIKLNTDSSVTVGDTLTFEVLVKVQLP